MAEADGAAVDQEYRRYCAEIDLYEKEFKPWETRGKKVLKIYKDLDNTQGRRKRFNVLWSNVQTLQPALYARTPQPVAERRFKDSDPVGRTASEVIERCLSYTIDCQNYDGLTRCVVSDRLLPGRGVAWHRYEATGEEGSEEYSERVVPEYVYWEDFGHNVARTWDEVWLVWRKVYMERAELVKRFKDVGQKIPLDYTPKGLKDEKTAEDIKKACIYEGWDKKRGKVVFLSKSWPKMIESQDDPIKLTGMFPCQRPLYATVTTDSLVPTPDYALYQTQAQELEELTARIDALQKALKLVGVYDASAAGLATILNAGYENKMVPVENWAKFSEKGGLDGSVSFLPIKEVAETLIALYESREKSKQDLYEITGIADIIRGNSEPEETATAQQIKGRFAVLRISDAQSDVQRWVRDGMRIMGEIIAEHYDLETIKAISGMKLPTQAEKQAFIAEQQLAAQTAQGTGQQPQPPDEETAQMMGQPTWEEVHALLSSQVLREFRIDIETDSTIRTDEDADRLARTEFLKEAGSYLDKAAVVYQTMPEMGPLMGELLMFGVRSFRSARQLEPVFEDAMKKLSQPKPPPPDPELQKVQAQGVIDKELTQMEAQTSIQVEASKQRFQMEENLATAQIEDARAERENQRQMELEKYKADLKAQTDLQVAGLQAQQADADRQYEASQKGADRESAEKTKAAELSTTERTKSAELSVKERTEQAKMKHEAEQGDKQREHEAKTAADGEKKSGEKRKARDSQLQAAQKLLEALTELKGSTAH